MRKNNLDKQRQEDLRLKIQKKEKKTKKLLHELSKRDPREIFRDSEESKQISKKLFGQKYYYIPE